MLSITRKKGEWLHFLLPDGRKIRLTFGEFRRDKTQVNIDAPNDVEIVRGELLDGWQSRGPIVPVGEWMAPLLQRQADEEAACNPGVNGCCGN